MSIQEKIKNFLKTDKGKQYEKDKKEIEDLIRFSETDSGKSLIKRLSKDTYGLLNELFREYEKPNINNMLSIISQLEVKIQLLFKFYNTPKEVERMERLLTDMFSGD